MVAVAVAADLDAEARVQLIRRDRWVSYPQGAAMLERMTELLRGARRTHMPSLLVFGEPNIGKTAILKKSMRGHEPVFDESAGLASFAGKDVRTRVSAVTAIGHLLRISDAPTTLGQRLDPVDIVEEATPGARVEATVAVLRTVLLVEFREHHPVAVRTDALDIGLQAKAQQLGEQGDHTRASRTLQTSAALAILAARKVGVDHEVRCIDVEYEVGALGAADFFATSEGVCTISGGAQYAASCPTYASGAVLKRLAQPPPPV